MKKFALILIAWYCVWTLPAQQPDETTKRALEREVKTSGAYLYGEAVANTKEEAVTAAKSALITEINKEILSNYDWQFANTIQVKDVEYYSDMIELMRGNKFRVIAYVKQENLTAIFYKNELPEIELTDKDAEDTIGHVQQVQLVEETSLVMVSEKPQNTIATEIPNQQSAVYSTTSDGDLLGQIVNASSPRQIQAILNSNKKNGKAAYGTMDKLLQPEAAYLIVFNQSGAIIAILDKGNNSLRKDLISGVTYGREIFNNNQVIWFQLY